jgi:amino acid adenylation domain-containing protein
MGRRDQQVKVRGYRIELGEIERCLSSFTGINECTVTAVEDEKGSRYLCAYVVGVNEEKIEISELKDYLSRFLPDFMLPPYVVQMDKLPLGRTGKLDRSKLPDPRMSLPGDFAAPRDEIEEKVIDTWSDVLGISRELIGIGANFFELGGHSLKATVLTAKIHKVLKVKVPLVEIFNRQTVRELCRYIRNAVGERFFAVDKVEEREYYALSAAQKRLYIIRQMALDSTHYNMFYMFPLLGGVDKERLENTVGKLIDRHESLRTSFHMIDDEPVQTIHETVEFEVEYFLTAKAFTMRYKAKEREEKNSMQDVIRPFDLSKAPLLRVGVMKTGDTGHLLLVEMHHIISDGTSQGILEREFAALYAGENLAPLRLQYRDYAEWQNSNAQQAIMKKQEQYWLREFSGELPVLALPADYPRPSLQGFAGRQLRFFIDKDTAGFLKELCRQTDATPYMILLSVYNVLLAKLSGQEDIIIGTPTAGRRHADLQDIIGMFVNTLSMRNYPEGDKGFSEFLEEVKERTLDAYENQEYQFENLVDRVSVRRDAGRNPIFDVMFNFLNQADYRGGITGEDTDALYDEGEVKANFDIVFQGAELEGGIYFTVDYCTRIYKKETVSRFIRYFKRILSQIKENPTREIFSLQLISGEEKRQLLVDFNDTAAGYPADKTIHELFAEQVERTPDGTAVVGSWQSAVGKKERNGAMVQITYGELNQRSNRLANVLRGKGIGPDTIVGIMVERSPEMIAGILGILKAGGAYLPIDPGYPRDRIDYMLQDSNAAFLLTTGETLDVFKGTARCAPTICNLDLSLAYVIYTSGTTGQPKGILVEHRSLVNLCSWHNRYYGVTASDRATQYAGPGFDASVWEIFPYLTAGAGLYIVDAEMRLEVARLTRYFDRHCITICFLPTQVCEQFMLSDSSPVSLRVLLTGGDKLRGYVQRPYGLVNNYGPTENTVVTTSCVVDNHQPNIPIGKPISNTRVYILDRWNRLQPAGVPGELCIAGDGLARGCLNNPGFTAEKFDHDLWDFQDYRDEEKRGNYQTFLRGSRGQFLQKEPPGRRRLYKTGDLARWLADGNIEFMGRVDRQVKIRGYRIEPGEIESCLVSRPEVKEAVVADRVDNTGDRYLCAYVVPHSSYLTDSPGGETFEITELKNYLSEKIPAYMVPRYVVKIDGVPLTANGKVDRKALPEPGFEREGVQGEYEPPTNEVEEKMVEIWQDVLGIRHPGISDNFFEMGGDSVKAIQVTARMRKYGLELKVSDLFLHPTVKESAKCVAVHGEVSEGVPSSTPGGLEYPRLKKEELEEYEEEFSDLD